MSTRDPTATRATRTRSTPPTSSPTRRSASARTWSTPATITPELLRKLQGADGVEANVATGYHAIEFLLWGQDLQRHRPGRRRIGPPPTTRRPPARTAIATGARAYLKAATDLLVNDLEEMAGDWKEGGAARKELADKGADGGLSTILTGLGSLSYGELAGERIKLGLMLHDPEEEHDCFSDNTHNSDYYDEVGMASIWNGSYTRIDGSVVEGPSIRDYAGRSRRGGGARRRGVPGDQRKDAGAEGHRRQRQDGL